MLKPSFYTIIPETSADENKTGEGYILGSAIVAVINNAERPLSLRSAFNL
jgi:hypothetical protein